MLYSETCQFVMTHLHHTLRNPTDPQIKPLQNSVSAFMLRSLRAPALEVFELGVSHLRLFRIRVLGFRALGKA